MRHMRDVYAAELKNEYGSYTDEKCPYFFIYDYWPMLNEFGDLVIQVEDGSYQGDYYLLYRDGERYGYLRVGWGSCSGCDALQGCKSIEEVNQLALELQAGIQWFDSAELARAWFESHDFEGDCCYGSEVERFKQLCLDHLNSQ